MSWWLDEMMWRCPGTAAATSAAERARKAMRAVVPGRGFIICILSPENGKVGPEKPTDRRLLHVFRRGQDERRGRGFLVGLAAQMGDGRFQAQVAHGEGVLEDEPANLSLFQRFDELGRGVEANEDDLPRQAVVLKGPESTERRRFVRREDRVDIGEPGEEVFHGLVGRLRGRPPVLVVREDHDSGEFRAQGGEEALLTLHRALDARLDPDEDQPAAPLRQTPDGSGREDAALEIVGRDIGDVLLPLERRVEDDRRDPGPAGIGHGTKEGPVVERR